jgi:hypothetical protein
MTDAGTIQLSGSTEALVTQHTQYGVRQPDGTVIWDGVRYKLGTILFDALALKPDNHSQHRNWREYLDERAEAANVDKDEYAAKHQLIKRSVVVAVTAAEDTWTVDDLKRRGVIHDAVDVADKATLPPAPRPAGW